MTEFFTILILTFTIPGHGTMETAIPYPTAKTCGDAIQPVYETIRTIYEETGARCVTTSIMSSSMRPRSRPDP